MILTWLKKIWLFFFKRKRKLLPPPVAILGETEAEKKEINKKEDEPIIVKEHFNGQENTEEEIVEEIAFIEHEVEIENEIEIENDEDNEEGFHFLSDEALPFEIHSEINVDQEEQEDDRQEENDEKEVIVTVDENETENNDFMNNNQARGYYQDWMPLEFKYLEELMGYRLGQNKRPAFPDLADWELPMAYYLQEMGLDEDKKICLVLLIALAPHAFPDLFDKVIEVKIESPGDFPEIGGVRGKNFRGFIPTGQTAIFLIAGDDWELQAEVQKMFWSDHVFAKKKILWLEDMQQGEPVMSGKIIVAMDYIDRFLFETSAPPNFSTTFPARKIETELGVDDIVMNKEVKRHFKNLEDWINYNDSLMNEWGMNKRLRQGFRVLFYGPPGTGKTLTATILGNETGKEVYKIDLSMVVSKYIGETEKNLELLFARAEDKDWILFFDEADAIFGKRTSVRDAHDKYANQEVSYLLQRIEDFNGLVILATNMRNNIDDAFIRRFNDIVKFTIPSEEERKEIWEKSFPAYADYDNIPDKVKKYDITGGNIINVIQYAGIQAVKKRKEEPKKQEKALMNDGCKYTGIEKEDENDERLKYFIEDVIEGIRKEMIKEGRPFVL